MKRLTNKNQILEGYIGADVIKKLSDLEDIEEELGIDLKTLFNLKKNGGYFKVHNKVYFVKGENIYLYCYTFEKDIVTKIDFVIENVGTWNSSVLRYGKSWALTKEELEK